MNAQHITKLARAAKRDGLTLSWSLIRLAERLERAESLSTLQTTDAAERSAPNERLDDEALALVLMAVIAAYPTLVETCQLRAFPKLTSHELHACCAQLKSCAP